MAPPGRSGSSPGKNALLTFLPVYLAYEMGFTGSPEPEDFVIEAAEDVRVVIDPKSVPIVTGSTLDFDTALLGGGLKVNNPQAIHGCACGESFSI